MSKDSIAATESNNQPNTTTRAAKEIRQPALTDLIPFDRPKTHNNSTMLTRGSFATPETTIADRVTGIGASPRGRGSQVYLRLESEHTLWASAEVLAKLRKSAEERKIVLKSWNDLIGKDIKVYLEGKFVMADFAEAPKKHGK